MTELPLFGEDEAPYCHSRGRVWPWLHRSKQEKSMKLYHLFSALALLAPTLAHAQALERCGSFQDGPCTISMSSNTLEGTWIAQVANPGAPLMLFEVGTYHANGSYSGANVNPSHTEHKGVWLRIGDRKFAFTFMFFTRDDKGAFNGIIKARGVVTDNPTTR
jgi:hypothetical protein